MERYQEAAATVLGLIRTDPTNPFRQGYSFANALIAAAERHKLTEDHVGLAITAEYALRDILFAPEQYEDATSSTKVR